MSIRDIVTEVLQKGVLSDAQEDKIVSQIRSHQFGEEDTLAIDELMTAIARGQIRHIF